MKIMVMLVSMATVITVGKTCDPAGGVLSIINNFTRHFLANPTRLP